MDFLDYYLIGLAWIFVVKPAIQYVIGGGNYYTRGYHETQHFSIHYHLVVVTLVSVVMALGWPILVPMFLLRALLDALTQPGNDGA